MVDRWLVLGGWGFSPRPLGPLFGPQARLVDINPLMPRLAESGASVSRWRETLAGLIAPHLPEKPFGIAGWSTGAILAAALTPLLGPAAGVYIAATPSFCRRHGFPHGWKPAALRAMRDQIEADPAPLVMRLYDECGIGPSNRAAFLVNSGPADLVAGLTVLERVSLLPVSPLPCPSFFLHGKDDAVIPIEAGRYFSREAVGSLAEFDGGHAFFIGKEQEIAGIIAAHLRKTL